MTHGRKVGQRGAVRVEAELAIRGGTVVDGTGAPGVRADVGIAGGRVVAIDDPTDEQLTALTGEDIAPVGEGPRHRASP